MSNDERRSELIAQFGYVLGSGLHLMETREEACGHLYSTAGCHACRLFDAHMRAENRRLNTAVNLALVG